MDSKEQKIQVQTSAFEKEVLEGLTAFPKYLSSKFIYDEVGDKLFQDIMNLPEYYLTDAEFNIFKEHKVAIGNYFSEHTNRFDIIELGAGDGKKTKILLKNLLERSADFQYRPVDISKNAINSLKENLKSELPELIVNGLVGEYFQVLDKLKTLSDHRKVIMVLGSNIGNLKHPRAIQFLEKIQEAMHADDLLFMGFDQKKNPQVILDAYNDPTGVTAAFNKNILKRINKELGGNFNLDKFLHWEVYNPESGTAKSFLVSKEKQVVDIDGLSLQIQLGAWETIHTEISQKYDDDIVSWLAEESGLEVVRSFTDERQYYKNYLFKKTSL